MLAYTCLKNISESQLCGTFISFMVHTENCTLSLGISCINSLEVVVLSNFAEQVPIMIIHKMRLFQVGTSLFKKKKSTSYLCVFSCWLRTFC